MHPFSTSWKHQKIVRLSDVFREERKVAMWMNGLICLIMLLPRVAIYLSSADILGSPLFSSLSSFSIPFVLIILSTWVYYQREICSSTAPIFEKICFFTIFVRFAWYYYYCKPGCWFEIAYCSYLQALSLQLMALLWNQFVLIIVLTTTASFDFIFCNFKLTPGTAGYCLVNLLKHC